MGFRIVKLRPEIASMARQYEHPRARNGPLVELMSVIGLPVLFPTSQE